MAKAQRTALGALQLLETHWLATDPFVAAGHQTVADLLAYEEVAALVGGSTTILGGRRWEEV